MKNLAKVLMVCLALALAFSGVAAAGGPPPGAGAGKAPLYWSEAYDCSWGALDTCGPTYGFAVMNTNGNGRLIVEVSVKGGSPNATYDIWVNQYPCNCPLSSPTAPGALTTNGQGNGNAHLNIPSLDCNCWDNTIVWVSVVGGGQMLRSTAAILDK